MRWTRAQGVAAAVAGLAAIVVGGWWGLVQGDGGDARPSASRSTSADLGDALDLVPGCTVDTCRLVARRSGFRVGGSSGTLAVVARPEPCPGGNRASLHVLTPEGALWTAAVDDLCGDPVGGITRDAAGTAYLAMTTTGGQERLVVLRFGGDEPEDFDSLAGRFDGGRAEDVDGDGVLEIVVGRTTHRWTGEDFAPA